MATRGALVISSLLKQFVKDFLFQIFNKLFRGEGIISTHPQGKPFFIVACMLNSTLLRDCWQLYEIPNIYSQTGLNDDYELISWND